MANTLPSGVPSDATNVLSGNAAAIPVSGGGAVIDMPVTVCLNNQGASGASLGIYICIDCNTSSPALVHARPLSFVPGQTAQDIYCRATGVSAGTHQIDVYLRTVSANVQHVWTAINGTNTYA